MKEGIRKCPFRSKIREIKMETEAQEGLTCVTRYLSAERWGGCASQRWESWRRQEGDKPEKERAHVMHAGSFRSLFGG